MNKLLTVEDVAVRLNRSPRVVRDLIRRGVLPVVDLSASGLTGGRGRKEYRVNQSDLDAMIASCTKRLVTPMGVKPRPLPVPRPGHRQGVQSLIDPDVLREFEGY